MLTGHLGARAHDLVDGRLADEQRELALAHLVGCRSCQADVVQLREVKALLAGSAAPVPAAPPGLLAGLTAMRPEPPADPYAGQRPRPVLGEWQLPGWRNTLYAGALTLVGASAVTLMLVAPGPTRSAQPTPTASFTVNRTSGTSSVDADMGAGVTTSLRTRP